jgi:hypothetical protein
MADIDGFQFNGIEAVGDVELSSRIGKSSTDTDHVINIEDCKKYTGSSIRIMWSLSRVPVSGTTWAVKLSKPGGSCSTSSMSDLGGSCYEEFIVSEKTLDAYTNIKFSVPLDPLMGGDCSVNEDRTTNIYILLNEGGVISAQTIAFRVDLEPPYAPTIGEPKEGDQNVLVAWTDDKNSSESGIRYKIYYSEAPFDDTTKSQAQTSDTITGKSYRVSGLQNGVEYWFAVCAIDDSDNESPLSAVTSAMPVPSYDFWEYYKDKAGGGETGGFCFIATVAYRSPLAKQVQKLRDFRDRFLLPNFLGRALVSLYYTLSPPLARVMQRHETLRTLARIMLVPVVLFASFVDYASAHLAVLALVLFFIVLLCLLPTLAKRITVLLLVFLFLSSNGLAESPRNTMVELKFGPFKPDIDKEFGGKASPFRTVMGNKSLLMTQFEYDYEFFTGFGIVAMGATIGYSRAKGTARLQDDKPSNDTTTMHMIPLSISALYRFDWAAHKYNVPLVPYVKTGFDYYIWWITNAVGDVSKSRDGSVGQGGTFGGHATFGLAFLLDFLAPSMATTFDNNMGVNNTYIFAEYCLSFINDFGSSSSFDLSSKTFLFGISFEL